MALPPELQAGVLRELSLSRGTARRSAYGDLSRAYRAGRTSQGVDLAAYLVARLPATFAATRAVLGEVKRIMPGLAPTTMLDVGAGPGAASWAAASIWPELSGFVMVDRDRDFLALAKALAGNHHRLAGSTTILADLAEAGAFPRTDVAIAAYSLAEVPAHHVAGVVGRLWASTTTLVLVEPGTPAGFSRIRAARSFLLEQGASLIGPCPHGNPCPMSDPDWCHFAVRLPRSRAHMHAKGASVPFEDEKFCWLAATVEEVGRPAARIVALPRQSKAAIELKLCVKGGLERRLIARREGKAYLAARKLRWGDAL
jgi:ribosomal protein RSM22 (predicted rRNA methylase)